MTKLTLHGNNIMLLPWNTNSPLSKVSLSKDCRRLVQLPEGQCFSRFSNLCLRGRQSFQGSDVAAEWSSGSWISTYHAESKIQNVFAGSSFSTVVHNWWTGIIPFLYLQCGHIWGFLKGLQAPLWTCHQFFCCCWNSRWAWRRPGTPLIPGDNLSITWDTMSLPGVWCHKWLLLQECSCIVIQCLRWYPYGHIRVPVREQGLKSQICSQLFFYRGR